MAGADTQNHNFQVILMRYEDIESSLFVVFQFKRSVKMLSNLFRTEVHRH